MLSRIVEVWCKTPTGEQGNATYKALIGIVGFANDFTKIVRAANATLELNPDVPLGEHTLCLKSTADIKPNAEILLAYGPKSEFCKAPRRKRILTVWQRRHSSRKKAARAEIPAAQADGAGESMNASVEGAIPT